MLNKIKEIWRYKYFIIGGIKREFQIKYKKSIIGVSWMIVNPIFMIAMYTLIFGKIMLSHGSNLYKEEDYVIYLCTGMLMWTLFSEVINNCTNIFVNNANAIKKIKFPHLCLPITVAIGSLINFLATFVVFILCVTIYKKVNVAVYIAFIPIFIIEILFAVSIGIVIGMVNVFFRDVSQVIQLILQVLFWLTPIVYSIEIIPERIQFYINLNPLTHIINSCRLIIMQNNWPNWQVLFDISAITFFMIFFSIKIFNKMDSIMIDEL